MHLGNGALTPECAYLTLGGAAAGLAVAAVAARREPLERGKLTTAGALCAAVYAAQMVNLPVLPFSSAHLVGGVLLAWCLGPALGSLTMAVVLAVQALFLGDGGVMALGANVINMALVPAGLVWLARRSLATKHLSCAVGNVLSRRAGIPILTVAVLSFVSVLLAAGLIVGEVSLFRSTAELSNLGSFAGRMFGLHAWIGLGEAMATSAVVLALVALAQPGSLRLNRWRLAGVAAVSMLLVLAVLPFASNLPDGYEAAVEASGLKALLLDGGASIGWQASLQAGVEGAIPGESLVALTTMCLAALVACGVTLACRARPALARVSKNRAA